MKSKFKFEHWVAILGFALGILFILSKNNVFPPSTITDLLSSKYCLYIAFIFVGLGYFISKMEAEEKEKQQQPFYDSSPGLGEKKYIVSDKKVDVDSSDFSGGNGGD